MNDSSHLTPSELELIENYSQLSAEKKAEFIQILSELLIQRERVSAPFPVSSYRVQAVR